jgi:hypothetical protein
MPIVISFMPNNVGSYNKNLEINLLQNQYKFLLQVLGKAKEYGDKKEKQRGPECLP